MTRTFPSRISTCIVFCCIILTLFAFITLLPAQARAGSVSSAHNSVSNHVTILILDMSGSMAATDPNGLRCAAADAYIDLSGSSDYIGVVGLDNNSGISGGLHNFQRAQIWSQPIAMATLQQRLALKVLIKNDSNNCRPNATTPTYDALNSALQMLTSATQNGKASGSVVLLTDGEPDPDTAAQINAINKELVPNFKQNGWPINTIAIGKSSSTSASSPAFDSFLSSLSNATSGKFYSTSQGISPFNIIPFVTDIVSRYSQRILGQDIPQTPISGTTSRNFVVPSFTESLDAVVVTDTPTTAISLIDPNGQLLTQNDVGIFVSQSTYYVIFSIDQPQPGPWTVRVSGSGNFLMNTLRASSLSLSEIGLRQANTVIPEMSPLALGQPITTTVTLTKNGQAISGKTLSLTGIISYTGGVGQYSQPFTLQKNNTPGTYIGTVTVPPTAPPGSYDILINASNLTTINIVASRDRSVRIEQFPVPFLISPQTQLPVEGTVDVTIVQWGDPLQWLYSLPILQWLGPWPLQNQPVQPSINVPGRVEWQGNPYSGATITAIANLSGTSDSLPVSVIHDSNGQFHILFVPPKDGIYNITFQTSGTFQDSYGDFTTVSRTIHIITKPPTLSQTLHAWLITAFYLLLLVLVIYLIRFSITPSPFGEFIGTDDGEIIHRRSFSRARRGIFQWFFRRNWLLSRQAGMPMGLQFRFRYGGRIEVRPHGPASANWQYNDGKMLSYSFQPIQELIYHPNVDDHEGISEIVHYIFTTKNSGNRSYYYDDDDDAYRNGSLKRRTNSRRRKARITGWDDYEDY